jgi:hypothetical protein
MKLNLSNEDIILLNKLLEMSKKILKIYNNSGAYVYISF